MRYPTPANPGSRRRRLGLLALLALAPTAAAATSGPEEDPAPMVRVPGTPDDIPGGAHHRDFRLSMGMAYGATGMVVAGLGVMSLAIWVINSTGCRWDCAGIIISTELGGFLGAGLAIFGSGAAAYWSVRAVGNLYDPTAPFIAVWPGWIGGAIWSVAVGALLFDLLSGGGGLFLPAVGVGLLSIPFSLSQVVVTGLLGMHREPGAKVTAPGWRLAPWAGPDRVGLVLGRAL